MEVKFGEFPVLDANGKWTGEWRLERIRISVPFTNTSGISLARDLKRGNNTKAMYAENRRGRSPKMKLSSPADVDGYIHEYETWCKKRKHVPHPGSIDPDHPVNRWRFRCPPREKVA
jgi:hypothetical protein